MPIIKENQILYLSLSFIAILTLLLAMIFINITRIVNTNSTFNFMYNHSILFAQINKMRDSTKKRIVLLHEMNSFTNDISQSEILKNLNKNNKKYDVARGILINRNNEEPEKTLIDKQHNTTILVKKLEADAIDLILSGKHAKADIMISDFIMPANKNIINNLTQLTDMMHKENKIFLKKIIFNLDKDYKNTVIFGIIAISACLLIGGFVIIKTKNTLAQMHKSTSIIKEMNEELQLEINEREHYEVELSKSEILEKTIRESVLDSMITIDNKGTIQFCNAATIKMFGYDREDLLGSNISMLMLESHAEKHSEYLSNYLQTGNAKVIGIGRSLIGQRKDKSTIPIDLSVTEVKIENKLLFVGVIHDITKQRQADEEIIRSRVELERKVGERTKALREANKQLSIEIAEREKTKIALLHKASHDGLTGLVNRGLFYEQLNLIIEQARRRHNKVAVFYLDLDGFKQVNDIMGHGKGDQVLKEVATRLLATVRAEDIVARLGGDEFAIIFGNIEGENSIDIIANKIINAVSSPFSQIEDSVAISKIGISIGISSFPNDSDDSETLVKYADQAMYKAKKRGKGQYVLYQTTRRAHSINS